MGVARRGQRGGGGAGAGMGCFGTLGGEPGAENEYQILLYYFCATPMQALVEPRFIFCLHILTLRQFIYLFPPTHPRQPLPFFVGSPPRTVWVVYLWLRPGLFGDRDCVVWLGPA